MDITTLINIATGQFGALVLSIFCLYHLMSYHRQVIDRMYSDAKEDRELYRTTLLGISSKMDKIGDDIIQIKTSM